jgi:CheY-like chemotaxis protein
LKPTTRMDERHKILLLDDDPDLLDMYREILAQLPSRPEIHTATSGPRGLALLETHPFRLLICDLKMPKMDGLQVLSVVRRKYPALRTVALTSVADEEFRSRIYALGVDLFWQKPASEQETKLFLECIESLLGREAEAGFRGVQSKSLVDLVQLECISQSSSTLRITNGPLSGKIWIHDGELIDAETDGARGEEAFQKILAWRAGSFETLPPDPARPRTIFKSYNALLLETAQAIDESRGGAESGAGPEGASPPPVSVLSALAQVEGVEFVLAARAVDKDKTRFEARGLENPDRLANWSRRSFERFRALGEQLRAGPLQQIEGLGPQRHVALTAQGDTQFCVGWRHSLATEEIRDRMRKVLALWA